MRYERLALLSMVLASVGSSFSQPAPAAEQVAAAPPTTQSAQVPTHAIPPNAGSGTAPSSLVSGSETPVYPVGEWSEPGPQWWAQADYLLWWVKDGPSPFPLLTTGPPASQGVPGRPGTVVLFGGSPFDYGTFSGLRFAAGYQGSADGIGLEVGGLLLEQRALGVSAGADNAGVPLLARPIVSPFTRMFSSTTENNPTIVTTHFTSITDSRFWGAEANLTGPTLAVGLASFRPLLGFRYLDLYERLNIDNQALSVAPFGNLVTGSIVSQKEVFHTRNQLYGGQLGLQGELQRGSFFLEFGGKLTLGGSHEVVLIDGVGLRTSRAGVSVPTIGALLAGVTNSGRQSDDRFAVAPELSCQLGYVLSPNLRVSVGYTFLYWSDVARPADQIDPVVNTLFRLGIGPAVPAPQFNHTDFWAQGLNFGLALRF